MLVEAWGAGLARWVPGGIDPLPAPLRRGVFRCQSCGAAFDWARRGCLHVVLVVALAPLALMMGFGTLLFCAMTIAGRVSLAEGLGQIFCVGSVLTGLIALLVSIARPLLAERRWPIVDAPRPSLTKPASGLASRRCECGSAARNVRIVQVRLRGMIPIGEIHEYSCPACKRTFNLHNGWSVAFSMGSAAFLTAVGALVTAFPPGSAVGAESSNRWFGVGLLAIGVLTWIVPTVRIAGRLRHRGVPPTRF